jgi:hypothetical protein
MSNAKKVCNGCQSGKCMPANALCCAICENWIHKKCSSLPEALLNGDTDISKLRNIAFMCDQCVNAKQTVPKETTSLQQDFKNLATTLEARLHKATVDIQVKLEKIIESKLDNAIHQTTTGQQQTAAKLDEVVTKIGSMGQAMQSTVQSYAQAVQSMPGQQPGATANAESGNKFVRNIVYESIKENLREEQRKCNVVVFGLPEGKSEKVDMDTFTTLCGAELNVTLLPTKSRRLGLKPLPDKYRPLLVTLPNNSDTRRVLAAAKLLRTSTTDNVRNIYIQPDLSKDEQEKQKLLREERRTRIQNGETGIVIRGGRIVQKNPHTV